MKLFLIFVLLGATGAYIFLSRSFFGNTGNAAVNSYTSLYEITATSLSGQEVELSQYQGKVLLIVNTASRCGFTSQYEELEKLYKQYQDEGLVVLGFPSNDFLRQEPGTNEEIARFCKLNYGITFPMFRKDHVKGKNIQPVYAYLTTSENKELTGAIKWNFEKFIIGKNGQVLNRFYSKTKPLSQEIINKIEKALNA